MEKVLFPQLLIKQINKPRVNTINLFLANQPMQYPHKPAKITGKMIE